jgi:hypothetical protein
MMRSNYLTVRAVTSRRNTNIKREYSRNGKSQNIAGGKCSPIVLDTVMPNDLLTDHQRGRWFRPSAAYDGSLFAFTVLALLGYRSENLWFLAGGNSSTNE